MQFDEYDQKNGKLLRKNTTFIDFGKVGLGGPADKIKVIRPIKTTESSVTGLKFFLRSEGGLSNVTYGIKTLSTIDSALVPGDETFTPMTLVEEDSPNPSNPDLEAVNENDFIHLDVSSVLESKSDVPNSKFGLLFDFT